MFFTNAVLPLIYISILFFLIWKIKFFHIPGLSRWVLPSLFIAKILAGIALTLIYTYYYTDRYNSDIYKYFDDSRIIYDALFHKPLDYLKMMTGIGDGNNYFNAAYYSKMEFWFKEWDYHLFNDNRTVIRFNAFIRIFSAGSIYVHTIFMAFLSFLGFVAIFKTFLNYLKDKMYVLLFSVFLLPSVLFWTSGVLKEGLLMFAFGFFIFSFQKMMASFQIKHLIIFILSILLLSVSKFYVMLAATPGLIAMIWLRLTNNKYPFLKFFVVHLILFLIAINNDYLMFVLYKKQKDFIASLGDIGYVGSYFQIPELKPETWSLMKNIPVAIFNTLFRPHVFEINSPVVLLAAFENAFIIVTILISIIFFNKKQIRSFQWLYFSIFFTLIMFALCGLTTPVMGALVRYKVPAIPFLFIALLFITDTSKIKSIIVPWFRKNHIE